MKNRGLFPILVPSLVLLAPWFVHIAMLNAECDQDCNPNDTGLCQGSNFGSCPGCVNPFTGLCSDSPGITSHTGMVSHGSIQGTKTIAWASVPCTHHFACINGEEVSGDCEFSIIFQQTGCFGDQGQCQHCVLQNQFTTGFTQDCRVVDDCGSS